MAWLGLWGTRSGPCRTQSGFSGRLLRPAPTSLCLAPSWKVSAQSSKPYLTPTLLWIVEPLESPAGMLSEQISTAPLELTPAQDYGRRG